MDFLNENIFNKSFIVRPPSSIIIVPNNSESLEIFPECNGLHYMSKNFCVALKKDDITYSDYYNRYIMFHYDTLCITNNGTSMSFQSGMFISGKIVKKQHFSSEYFVIIGDKEYKIYIQEQSLNLDTKNKIISKIYIYEYKDGQESLLQKITNIKSIKNGLPPKFKRIIDSDFLNNEIFSTNTDYLLEIKHQDVCFRITNEFSFVLKNNNSYVTIDNPNNKIGFISTTNTKTFTPSKVTIDDSKLDIYKDKFIINDKDEFTF